MGVKVAVFIKRLCNFLLCILFNMLLNLEWTIPAWILLALHFVLGVPIVWFWVALAVWALSVLLWTDIFGRLTALGNIPDKPKENKNPYSYKKEDK